MNRTNITLYIGTQAADLSDDSLVQMNYTTNDLTSPAAVKNSYSQQVKLPGTARNDAIFGAIYRADWWPGGAESYTGTGFDPLIRTPFALYDETGTLLESGYMKLNSISTKNGARTYTVTLYGGLGSFFYSLTYDDQGEEMTLGALPFVDDPQGVGFIIDKNAVAAAWERLAGRTPGDAARKWDVVNFAPAYNGFPEGEFSADKAVGDPVQVGGVASTEVDGVNYTTYGANKDALFELGEDFTEWQTKDLRSYMQRPVVSVRGLLDGVRNYAARKGFGLDLDPAFFHENNPYFARTWMTLPLLAGRSQQGSSGEYKPATLPLITDKVGAGQYANPLYLPVSLPEFKPGASVTVTCEEPQLLVGARYGVTDPTGEMGFNIGRAGLDASYQYVGGTIAFVQLQLCDAAGEPLSGSPIQVCLTNSYNVRMYTTEQLVDLAGLDGCRKDVGGVDENINIGTLTKETIPIPLGQVDMWVYDHIPGLTVTGTNIASARVCVEFRTMFYKGDTLDRMTTDSPLLYDPYPNGAYILMNMTAVGGWMRDVSVSYTTPETFRSGVEVTQGALFADTMTPAAFLLSYTKTFGLHYLYDKGTKTVRIVSRNTLYDGQTLDLQERIDRSRDIAVSPLSMSSKWLRFAPEEVDGEFVTYYKQKRGAVYGSQKVNTGFDFDANTVDVLDSAHLNGGAEVLEKSKYFNNVTRGAIAVPSPFLNGQASYSLYHNGDPEQSTELEGLTPDYTSKVVPFNAALPSYDIIPKLQAHGADNSGNEGGGVLLFLQGNISDNSEAAAAYARFRITDDTQAMYDLNDGEPCWDLTGGLPATYMPIFGRFYRRGGVAVYSQDFGTPAEIDIPAIRLGADSNVFAQFWRSFIADRYNVATRILTAYVDWRGFQVDERLLRHFYHFDGALWVLNKIENFSMTTTATTKCEFVKVQDLAAYASGQLLPADYYLKLDGADGDLSRAIESAGGSLTIPIDTNGTPLVLSSSAGLTATITDGALVLDVAANATPATVEKSVTVALAEVPAMQHSVVVTQAAAAVWLRVQGSEASSSFVNAPAAGGDMIISVVSNGTRVVRSQSPELVVSLANPNIATVTIPANTTTSTRTFGVTFGVSEDESIMRTLFLYQAAGASAYTLLINGKSGVQHVLAPADGGTLQYKVESNGTPVIQSTTLNKTQVKLLATTDAISLSIRLFPNISDTPKLNTVVLAVQEDPTVTATLHIEQAGGSGGEIKPVDPVAPTEVDNEQKTE